VSDNLTLAITTIGDLLLRNVITKDKDKDVNAISNINLVIPDFQRPYKWKAKNVIQLWDDILEAKNANKETYRVGTLILFKDQEKGKEVHKIVDGQQRIITFSLLLKALKSDSLINFLEQPLADNKHNTHNVPNNYRTLVRRVNNINDEKEKGELFEYIHKKCELIVLITDDISEAFQFFDSQNARGKKLYPHDLLKAYHLREMNDMDAAEIEKTVKVWEDIDQVALSALFSKYLYRVKEWTKGNRAEELTEQNVQIFKGITRKENYPYAQFYKGAYAYSYMVNHSAMPFVAGIRNINAFQINAPIIAGKPFFDYAEHYFNILKDIQNNDKYERVYIKNYESKIINTLDLPWYKNGVGNCITRLLLDTAILLYVDRFCPEIPEKKDLDMLDRFVVFAFIWAYSLRVQYTNLGWATAQNYIMGVAIRDGKRVINSFNIYRVIAEADSPVALLSMLPDKVDPLPNNSIVPKYRANIDEHIKNDKNILHYFSIHKFYGGQQ